MVAKLVYDPKTMKMVTPAAAKASAKDETIRLSLSENLANILIDFMDEDGVERVADTAQGRKTRTSNALRVYVETAVSTFIATRQALGSKEEEEEPEE